MKKSIILLGTLLVSGLAFSQVGLNTPTPKATLDVVGKATDNTSLDGVIVPRMTGDQLRAKTYTTEQTGAVIYATSAPSILDGQVINVTKAALYIFDGTVWGAGPQGPAGTPGTDGLPGTPGPSIHYVLNATTNGGLVRTGAGTNASEYSLGLTPGTTNGQVMTWNGTAWSPAAVSFTEADGVIGNEVLNATANGGLTRAGSGTAASPYTLGLTSGTANGQVMTWNGTAWSPAAVSFTEADGVIGNEVLNATANGGLTRAGSGTAASPYTLGLTSGTANGQVMTWNGTTWSPTAVSFTEVDGVIGNEVLDATTNGGLTRAGSGTAASPYTLGLTSGTANGQVMTWNGTTWSPTTPAISPNIYNTNGTFTANRTATIPSGQWLNFDGGGYMGVGGTDPLAKLNVAGFIQFGPNDSHYGVGRVINDATGEKYGLTQSTYFPASGDARSPGTRIYTSGSSVSGHISFGIYTGPTSYSEWGRFAHKTGNLGINTINGTGSNNPTEKLDVNGNVRIRTLPANGTANAHSTYTDGTMTATQNQTFTASRIVVSDDRGVLGYVPGLPLASNTDGTLNTLSIGYGTVQTFTGTQKLKVNGSIVTAGATYPDYVFEDYYNKSSVIKPAYKFSSLYDTEKFIKENKHLPGVTSIKELEKTTEGYSFNISDLSVQSLEKIEELYLHTIEQQKQIDEQKSQITLLLSITEKLKSEVELLKKQ